MFMQIIAQLSTIFTKNYAILGNLSKNFFNYRHHTNIQTMYNLLLEGGYTPNEIVALQQDDIFRTKQNIFYSNAKNNARTKHFTNKIVFTPKISMDCQKVDITQLNLKTLLNFMQLNHPQIIHSQ